MSQSVIETNGGAANHGERKANEGAKEPMPPQRVCTKKDKRGCPCANCTYRRDWVALQLAPRYVYPLTLHLVSDLTLPMLRFWQGLPNEPLLVSVRRCVEVDLLNYSLIGEPQHYEIPASIYQRGVIGPLPRDDELAVPGIYGSASAPVYIPDGAHRVHLVPRSGVLVRSDDGDIYVVRLRRVHLAVPCGGYGEFWECLHGLLADMVAYSELLPRVRHLELSVDGDQLAVPAVDGNAVAAEADAAEGVEMAADAVYSAELGGYVGRAACEAMVRGANGQDRLAMRRPCAWLAIDEQEALEEKEALERKAECDGRSGRGGDRSGRGNGRGDRGGREVGRGNRGGRGKGRGGRNSRRKGRGRKRRGRH